MRKISDLRVRGPFERQDAILERTGQEHVSAEVRHPGLLPLCGDRVVTEEAVADEPVVLLVKLMHHAATENGVDVGARLRIAERSLRLEGIPVPDPEIELVTLRLGTAWSPRGCDRRGRYFGRSRRNVGRGAQLRCQRKQGAKHSQSS